MISSKSREIRRGRASKMTKNIERLYKEGKCVECSVVVTPMDFAKILGKFTKVKIQYESSSQSKSKVNTPTSPNINTRLKNNENGMVHLHRKVYNQHPAKELDSKRSRNNLTSSPQPASNILKEKNSLKKVPLLNGKNAGQNRNKNLNMKRYGIVFMNPIKHNNDFKNKISLKDLLPHINESILPSDNWHVTYLPNSEEPKDDKVYDRIAAELEDLMYNEKSVKKFENKIETDQKIDEFPSIMDILNDNANEKQMKVDDQNESFKPNLESSDVEAMLLGKSNSGEKGPITMDLDNSDVSKLIQDVEQLNEIQDTKCKESESQVQNASETQIDNPHSPSILDEALQKGIEEHLPFTNSSKLCSDTCKDVTEDKSNKTPENVQHIEITENKKDVNENNTSSLKMDLITHVVFKKTENGKCLKTVTCPKNLKYSIELEEKSVEFLGAPKYISSLEDLQVLLQIVNESELDRLYVLY